MPEDEFGPRSAAGPAGPGRRGRTPGVRVFRSVSSGWRSHRRYQASLRSLPEGCVFQRSHVVNGVVALAGRAGHLVGDNLPHHLRGLVVFGLLFEDPHAEVAVQALAVIEWRVEFNFLRLRGLAEVLNIEMAQPA